MKNDIHPDYVVTEVTCSCGNTFTTRSTAKSGQLHADVCSACHPFYTGKQKIMDVGGRVDKFEKRYGKRTRTLLAPPPTAPVLGGGGRRCRVRAPLRSDARTTDHDGRCPSC